MDVTSTVGAVVVAASLSCWTCGIVVSLVATYFATFKTDRLVFRCGVVLATVLSLVDTAVNCSWAYSWAVDDFATPANLALMPWQFRAYFPIMTLTVVLVQHFYLYRLCAVSKNWWLFGIYVGAFCIMSALFSDFAKIGASMSLYLYFKPRKMGAGMKSSAIRRIVLQAVQTNALSLVNAAGICAMFGVYPTALHYAYFGFMQTKIYSGSAKAPPTDTEPRTTGLGARSKQQPVHVSVHHEIEVDNLEFDRDGADSVDKAFGASGGFGTGAPYKVQFDRPVGVGDVEKAAGAY
ncbi:hypothetical protein JCM8097_000312 [Rhodosporidiobolus ruineniae]